MTWTTAKTRWTRLSLDVPVKVEGNTRYGDDMSQHVFVKAARGAVVPRTSAA
jgi:hypothetical protein